ncbi:hypothetical protein ACFWBF_20990 [Streptomyces sp. NPDC060028]|uniref:hypothetical protein n=1 Tax=Streptomyces sp. NPDC060028 TaxID=3347041 RepID=UPI0036A79834
MADKPDTKPIHSVYAQRFAADLETNRKEQEDVSAQIRELDERLKQLKADEGWLSGIQATLPEGEGEGEGHSEAEAGPQLVHSPGDENTAAVAESAGTVPRPRRARKAPGAAASGTKAKAAPRKSATPAVKKTTAPKAVKTAEPPLRELVLALLVAAAEPRMVSEVGTELAAAHPGRPASTQVVRNTLEALAKKGSIEKEHKQGSVMYTAPKPSAAEPVSDAPEEKVTAEV